MDQRCCTSCLVPPSSLRLPLVYSIFHCHQYHVDGNIFLGKTLLCPFCHPSPKHLFLDLLTSVQASSYAFFSSINCLSLAFSFSRSSGLKSFILCSYSNLACILNLLKSLILCFLSFCL